MTDNEQFISRCFDLARQGFGHVAPNPMVGAVLVHDGKIIGEGFHHQYGKAHAEVNAIADAEKSFPELVSASTLFVNLEPCSHFGKTPPCAELIIQKGIKKVVLSNTDPNPLVAGNGIKKLREAGIEVIENVLRDDGKKLNRRFFTFHEKKRPYIILKWAQTADGFIAPSTKEKIQISNEQSQELVHKWRSEEQAILVGRETALTDNPQLNVRLWQGRNPLRLVIDSKLSLPGNLKLFDKKFPTIVFNSIKNSEDGNLRYVKLDFKKYILNQLLSHLNSKNIQSVIVEGGAFTLQKFIDENLWDEARIFTSPKNISAGVPAPKIPYSHSEKMKVGDDELEILFCPTNKIQ